MKSEDDEEFRRVLPACHLFTLLIQDEEDEGSAPIAQ